MEQIGEPIPSAAIIFDIIAKTMGLAGLGSMLLYLIKFSRWTGRVETEIKDGFKTNEDTHDEIKGVITGHGHQLTELERAMGRIEGEHKK